MFRGFREFGMLVALLTSWVSRIEVLQGFRGFQGSLMILDANFMRSEDKVHSSFYGFEGFKGTCFGL